MSLPKAVYPGDQTPELVAATLAELKSFNSDMTGRGLEDIDGLAVNLIGFFLTLNWVGYDTYVVDELQRRLTMVTREQALAAVGRAKGDWVSAYYD